MLGPIRAPVQTRTPTTASAGRRTSAPAGVRRGAQRGGGFAPTLANGRPPAAAAEATASAAAAAAAAAALSGSLVCHSSSDSSGSSGDVRCGCGGVRRDVAVAVLPRRRGGGGGHGGAMCSGTQLLPGMDVHCGTQLHGAMHMGSIHAHARQRAHMYAACGSGHAGGTLPTTASAQRGMRTDTLAGTAPSTAAAGVAGAPATLSEESSGDGDAESASHTESASHVGGARTASQPDNSESAGDAASAGVPDNTDDTDDDDELFPTLTLELPLATHTKVQTSKYLKSTVKHADCPPPTLPEFAVIGRSNVGKSSLINMITNSKRLAHVSKEPGKTRCINHFLINEIANSWYLVDLPGYGFARVGQQQRLQFEEFTKAYFRERKNLVMVFMLVDSTVPPQPVDVEYAAWLADNGVPFAIVFTKTDKRRKGVSKGARAKESNMTAFKRELLKEFEFLPPSIATSAGNGTGKKELLHFIGGLRVAYETGAISKRS